MTVRALLLASAAALSLMPAAHAADAIVAAEPEPLEYVRVCDAYGKGYFYIPGTETCLKIGGYVRMDSTFGEEPYAGVNDGWVALSRGELEFDARNDTELGLLRSYIELRGDATRNGSSEELYSAYIEIAGFRAGYTDSFYDTWLNSAGAVINDDVIDYTGDRTNQLSYVYGDVEKGFSAMIGIEDGAGSYAYGPGANQVVSLAARDTPYFIGGAKYEDSWGGLFGIIGYDTRAEAIGAKIRVELAATDKIKLFAMAGYQSDWDNSDGPLGTRRRNYYGPWNGDWAAWGGFTATLTEKTSLNGQVAWEEDGTIASALNVEYKLTNELLLLPELNYTKFHGLRGNGEAFGGTLRLQRDF
ncbi:porin [Xaviernesmea oryzae]|uniref:Porin n=1 Tax=Xaviernesmea oryzae TaxID=464029 RepID=A0A1Q9AUP9_9HYPH|nr:porin [Xaviernesmea oryzae]OLP59153.1 porin [Xaviernesmea oryzae]SEK84122.1 Porin subfamily protein [Xaviernesmea oryzae]